MLIVWRVIVCLASGTSGSLLMLLSEAIGPVPCGCRTVYLGQDERWGTPVTCDVEVDTSSCIGCFWPTKPTLKRINQTTSPMLGHWLF